MNIFRSTIILTAITTLLIAIAVSTVNAETSAHHPYDLNSNGTIENNEVASYILYIFDTDQDGFLSHKEYDNQLVEYFYSALETPEKAIDTPDPEVEPYIYWDQDKDEKLNLSEFDTLLANVGIYRAWDYNSDSVISSEEFTKGTFSAYDGNNDGKLSIEEWQDILL